MFAWIGRLVGYLFWGEGRDWRTRLTILRGRESDSSHCTVEGTNPAVVDKALDIICDMFMIPESQKFCLRPGDILMDIYQSLYRHAVADMCEFEHLASRLEKACQRKLPRDWMEQIRTVGDVIRFLGTYAAPGRPEDSTPIGDA